MTTEQPSPMRRVFGEHLVRMGQKHKDLVVLDADTSSSTQTRLFQTAFPDRFLNCGLAEANLGAVAAGLAAAGMRPLVSAFAFLLATRASDQVRSQIAYSRLPVIFAGGYAGLSDFADGGSHQSVEDLSFFLSMPNMTVICPADATETELALEAALEHDGPVFLRLSRAEVNRLDYPLPFQIGKALIRQPGNDVALVSTGHIFDRVRQAAEQLTQKGISVRLIDLHTIKPLDGNVILSVARECRCMVTCEEHSVYGGMGSYISRFLAETCPIPMRIIAIPDQFGQSGSYAELQRHYGLSPEAIITAVEEVLQQKQKR